MENDKLKLMYLGIDIGGTKTLLGVFDTSGTLKEKSEFPTPEVYADFIKELDKHVAKLATKDFRAVGVGAPGKIDREHGVGLAFGNLIWENVPLEADIETVIKAPAVIENDAKLAGLSEALLIKGKFKKVLYLTIGTGIGTGIIINGIIDPAFADSEGGHILLEHNGKLVRWEKFASGSAFRKKFGKPVGKIEKDDNEAWYYIARSIAIGLIDLIAVTTPQAVIFGGGVGKYFDSFKTRLQEELKIYDNPLITLPVLLKAKRAEEAVLYGAYHLIKDRYEPFN